jgi:hypothetical protein
LEDGEEVAQGVTFLTAADQEAGQGRKLSGPLLAALLGQVGGVLGDVGLETTALGIQRQSARVPVRERRFDVLAGRFLPMLDPVEEAVEAVGNCGELVSHVVSRLDYHDVDSRCL